MSDELCVNTIRILSADVVQKAKSGHPGAPMGMAPLAHILWSKYMRFNAANPHWWNRDRFVLSNGHACALQYVMLHLTGYEDFTMDELKKFRQVGSKTPGHPENHIVKGGIEVTTGPLGQGISNAVGLAIAEANLAANFNKPGFEVFNNHTYVFCGDGCLQEGVSSEASSLAGHLGLNKLIVFYDDNQITIDGETSLSFTEDVTKRYESYGWKVITVGNGNSDFAAISAAIEEAHKSTDRPVMIKVRTAIGFGSKVEGTEKAHGAPLGDANVVDVKKKFGFDPEKHFFVSDEVKKAYAGLKEKGSKFEAEWNEMFAKYAKEHPTLADDLKRRFAHKLPEGWKASLPTYKPEDPAKATRQTSQAVIGVISKIFPELIGGSADLNPSTLTYMENSKDFQKSTPEGKNIRFGVREHGMAAICNGIHAYGAFISYGSTFLNFLGYAYGAVRLSAVSEFGVIYIMTHDSIGLGEDGPTHQPIESFMIVRSTPNILLLRPGDGNEVSGAYAVALENRHRPSVLCLSRQGVPNLPGTSIDGVAKGAYTIVESAKAPQLILVGTGSELHLCVNAAKELKDVEVRVVSMPSWELFREQPKEYRQALFPDGVPVLAVEAGSSTGWHEFAHGVVGMTTFGLSGPYTQVLEHFGFTTSNVVEKAKKLLAYYSSRPAQSLVLRPF